MQLESQYNQNRLSFFIHVSRFPQHVSDCWMWEGARKWVNVYIRENERANKSGLQRLRKILHWLANTTKNDYCFTVHLHHIAWHISDTRVLEGARKWVNFYIRENERANKSGSQRLCKICNWGVKPLKRLLLHHISQPFSATCLWHLGVTRDQKMSKFLYQGEGMSK